MTYGVDQCRVCGKPIPVLKPTALAEYEAAQRRPVVPEAEWRAAGLLAAPTRRQWNRNPADGCCETCGMKLFQKRWHYHRRGLIVMVSFVTVVTIVSIIVLFLPH